jgi:uncharacterized protein YcsI (UPF0317 family)
MDPMTAQTNFTALRRLPLAELRSIIRAGTYQGHTAGLAAGHLQNNLAILPRAYADDFERFCALNSKPCPLVGQSMPGDPKIPNLGADMDLRYDAPGYDIYRDGQLTATQPDIADIWTDDLVAFALGCSFTFENALIEAGHPIWHIANNTTVPMFLSSIQTHAVGPFGGGMVVSMRAIPDDQIDEVTRICADFPQAHGTPVHVGDPAAIGITDVTTPQWGDPAPIEPGQTPVFWACGVTPQAAILRAKLPLCISHEPGKMLIADISDRAPINIPTA